MKGINFMCIYLYFKCPWKTTFEEKVVCAVIEKQPDFITMTLIKLLFAQHSEQKTNFICFMMHRDELEVFVYLLSWLLTIDVFGAVNLPQFCWTCPLNMGKIFNVIFLWFLLQRCVCIFISCRSLFSYSVFIFLVEADAAEREKSEIELQCCQNLPPCFTVCTEIQNILCMVIGALNRPFAFSWKDMMLSIFQVKNILL